MQWLYKSIYTHTHHRYTNAQCWCYTHIYQKSLAHCSYIIYRLSWIQFHKTMTIFTNQALTNLHSTYKMQNTSSGFSYSELTMQFVIACGTCYKLISDILIQSNLHYILLLKTRLQRNVDKWASVACSMKQDEQTQSCRGSFELTKPVKANLV